MLCVALALLLLPQSDPLPPRVRPMDDVAETIVASGAESSTTVEQLLDTIEASDVVVYVQTTVSLPGRGVLTFMAHGAPLTYVLIRIPLNQSPQDRVAVLAHELTHAVEVAEARPPIRSEAGLAALYRRIGFRSRSGHDFESSRAQANERRARLDQVSAVAQAQARPDR